MSRSKLRVREPTTCRFTAVLAILGACCALAQAGFPATEAMAITLVSAAGAAETACWLVAPAPAFRVRIEVLVLILVVVVRLITYGYPVIPVIFLVTGGSWCATLVARRLTGSACQLPRLKVSLERGPAPA